MRWPIRLLTAGAAAVLFAGCVGVAPLPVVSRTPEYGQRLEPVHCSFIRPGQTTRAEVIARLGSNCVAFRRTHSIAYTWEMRGGGGVWWLVLVGPGGGVATGDQWVGGWRGFFVAFDQRDVVRAAELRKLSASRSLDENMDRWVAGLPKTSPPLETAGPLCACRRVTAGILKVWEHCPPSPAIGLLTEQTVAE